MQRFEIVNGVTEVEGIAEEKTTGAEEDEGTNYKITPFL